MIQTLEAVIDKKGKISVMADVRLKKNRRALVTILDEDPKVLPAANIESPTNQNVSDEDVLSVWANRKESASEIASQIRKRNRSEE
jgi:hypothetical protein